MRIKDIDRFKIRSIPEWHPLHGKDWTLPDVRKYRKAELDLAYREVPAITRLIATTAYIPQYESAPEPDNGILPGYRLVGLYPRRRDLEELTAEDIVHRHLQAIEQSEEHQISKKKGYFLDADADNSPLHLNTLYDRSKPIIHILTPHIRGICTNSGDLTDEHRGHVDGRIEGRWTTQNFLFKIANPLQELPAQWFPKRVEYFAERSIDRFISENHSEMNDAEYRSYLTELKNT